MEGLHNNKNCISGPKTCEPCYSVDAKPPDMGRNVSLSRGQKSLEGCRKTCLQTDDCLALAWDYNEMVCQVYGKSDKIWTRPEPGFYFEQRSCAKANSRRMFFECLGYLLLWFFVPHYQNQIGNMILTSLLHYYQRKIQELLP